MADIMLDPPDSPPGIQVETLPDGTKVIGGPPPIQNEDQTESCPKCKAVLMPQFSMGYGFAYGGGLGPYTCCFEDGCGWFYKTVRPPEDQ